MTVPNFYRNIRAEKRFSWKPLEPTRQKHLKTSVRILCLRHLSRFRLYPSRLGHSTDARTLLADYLIGELAEEDQTEYKSQYVYTDQNQEGGPTPIKWVIGKKPFCDPFTIILRFIIILLNLF